jgi:hypothetical protein
MNKRQRLADLRHKIFERAIELFGDNPGMSFTEARRQAAQQVAADERRKGGSPTTIPTPATPQPSSGASSNAKEELFAKIMSIKSRMTQEVATVAKSMIPRVRLREDAEPTTPKPTSVEPTPAPSAETIVALHQVYVGGSNRELIPDSDFPKGLIDPTTHAWANQKQTVFKPENEIDPNDSKAVEAALQRQQATFLRVVK